jgi:hypothetical protein
MSHRFLIRAHDHTISCNVVIMTPEQGPRGNWPRGPRAARMAFARGAMGWPGPRRGRGRRGSDERPTAEQRQHISAWFTGRVPKEWFSEAPQVQVDADEILVVGTLPSVELPGDASADDRATAEAARISGHREDTREQRVRIASEAEEQFGKIVSWGARCGDSLDVFTTASVPVMTRLRMPERHVLDTLIDAGVARSRSEALGWCVRLVAKNEEAWISELQSAFAHVEEVRSRGPQTQD